MRNSRRVVITGLGAVSSIGIGKDAFWEGLINGRSGISEVTAFDTTAFKYHMGGEVKKFNPEEFIPKRKIKFLGRASQLAIAAASLALKDAHISSKDIPNKKVGVILGTTTGERPMEDLIRSWAQSGLKNLDRSKIFQAAVNNISANVGIEFNATGLNYLIPTACAAGNYAVGYAYDQIQNGDLNFALAGGADAFSHFAFAGFQRLYAMSPDICRPFDKNRKGMLLGEGAGILLLESLDSARKRNADIYAEVLGYGLSCDAFHPTIPKLEGIKKVMEKTFKDAAISPDEIDYVCAHGTGTTQNDKEESIAINSLFGGRKVPVSSIKSMLGHTMGAASALESIACCLAIKNSLIPPTINFETPDPDCDIDCVPNTPREADLRVVLNNSYAFGGNNCCVAFAKV
ncbi:MAG: beta-ketoacyl-[acyl-carrier-protein] synthase family protein [Candidatus Omnitrophica bacterium]|nr:beta-ketoacyl-[acyl-carrier-protein] synthase family protein [Candidatus Omnitrophota bacterium]